MAYCCPSLPGYLAFWGKAQPVAGSAVTSHPLAYHSLDVAAVTQAYLSARPALLARLAEALGVQPAQALALAGFLAAGHDTGKFDPCFVAKQPAFFEALFPGKELPDTSMHPHAAVGLVSLLQYVHERWYGELDFELEFADWFEPLANATCGHHGAPQRVDTAHSLGPVARRAAWAFLDDVRALLGLTLAPFSFSAVSAQALRDVSFELAGVFTLCDWVGSNQAYFAYSAPERSLADYFTHAQQCATRALRELRLVRPEPASDAGFGSLYPAYAKTPTALQRYADRVELGAPHTPELFILEDETGAGKTEAAMTLAARLVASGHADGVVVSLPTQTTANSLFSRVAPLAHRLFRPGSQPSLSLAHGQAQHALERMLSGSAVDFRSGDIGAELSAWCTDSSKTALLADFGVCTVDQVVLSALPVKHYVLRQLGLGRKVLVVDEAHACEPYLMELLALTLYLHAQRAGSAIVLSATLPQADKLRLARAFAEGAKLFVAPQVDSASYPLATRIAGHGTTQVPLASARAQRRLLFKPLREGQEQQLIARWLEQGQCVCLLRNTVGAAQEDFDRYSTLYPGQVQLVHARFVSCHRSDNDAELLSRFGKTAPPEARRGRLVIATQVAEQSLDIDFDQLITDLAPLDALLQRAGRHRRHARALDGSVLADRLASDQREPAPVYVLMPAVAANEDFLEQLSAYTTLVYDRPAVLYRTAQLIEEQGGLDIPCGVRQAMEWVYDEAAELPEAIRHKQERSDGRTRAERQRARFVRLNPRKGYTQEQVAVPADECVTRLGEPSTRIVLCDAPGCPLFEDADQSSVSLRSSLLSLAPSEDGRARLCMMPDDSQEWHATARDRAGCLREVRYSRQRGLSVSRPLRKMS